MDHYPITRTDTQKQNRIKSLSNLNHFHLRLRKPKPKASRSCRIGNALTLPAPVHRLQKPLNLKSLLVRSGLNAHSRQSLKKIRMGILESKNEIHLKKVNSKQSFLHEQRNGNRSSNSNSSRKRKREIKTCDQVCSPTATQYISKKRKKQEVVIDDFNKININSDIENSEDVFNSPSKIRNLDRNHSKRKAKKQNKRKNPNVKQSGKRKGETVAYLTYSMAINKYRILTNNRQLDGLHREKMLDSFGRLVFHYRDADCRQRAADIQNGDWKHGPPRIKTRPCMRKSPRKPHSSKPARLRSRMSVSERSEGNGSTTSGSLTRGRTRELRQGCCENSPPERSRKKNGMVFLSSQKLHSSRNGKQPNMHIPMQIFFPGEVEVTSNLVTPSTRDDKEKINVESVTFSKVETPWFGSVDDSQKIRSRIGEHHNNNNNNKNIWDWSLCYDGDDDDMEFLSSLNTIKFKGCTDMKLETLEQIIEIFELEWELGNILQNVRVFRSDSKKFEVIASTFCENNPSLNAMRIRCRDAVMYSCASTPASLLNNSFMYYPFNRKGTLNEAQVGKTRIKSLYEYWIQKRQQFGSLLRQFQKSDLLQNWTGTIQPRAHEMTHDVFDRFVLENSDFEKLYVNVKEIIYRSIHK
mmetsp:Transcript_20309/g.24643  ORF Transcript_20309/g.24643 Transcript_20309/m.24643 type:complete len:637 (+) Transcript_20309:225-2135(+)